MGLLPLALNDFKDFFTLFSKCFSSFVHTTCSLSVLVQYLAFAEVHLRFAQHYQTVRLMDFVGVTEGAYRLYGTFALHGVAFQRASSDIPTFPQNLALQFHSFRFLPLRIQA